MTVVIVTLVAALGFLAFTIRSLRRELRRVAGHLEEGPDGSGSHGDVERESLAGAVAAFEDGVVVVDAKGNEVMRNAAGERFRGARHADALVEDALRTLLAPALRVDHARRGARKGPLKLALRSESIALHAARPDAPALHGRVIKASYLGKQREYTVETPIGALSLLAETMAVGEDSPVNTQLADRVQREATRLGRIVDDLLDLSLIEAQERPIRERVPVHVVLHEAAERVRGAADAVGIPLSVAPVATDLVVAGDRSQLVSAVTNLLDNAVKYSEPGQPVEVDATVADGSICISVRDHGIGIPSRDLERIFERFYRVDRARSRATGGTGLGLSIVRHVAQAHGGDVTVESTEGEGSTFRLRVPLPSSKKLSEAS